MVVEVTVSQDASSVQAVESDPDALHTFLITADGGLSDGARVLPEVREQMADLPDTSATFRLTHFDGVTSQQLSKEHLEFLKAWPVHDIHGGNGPRQFVNPNYAHAHRYTDLVTRCECGALLTRNYEGEHNALRDEHSHYAGCLPHYRLRARADMTEQRYELMVRLGKFGWKGAEMAPRFGVSGSSMSMFASRFNTDLGEVYEQYKRRAANTYAYLVRERGISAATVADVYGHSRTTMTRWAREFSSYDSSRGDNQFTRDASGQYTWATDTETNTEGETS